ncbi:MAG: hypothetical protein JWR07_5125 [Nevskia sp.]|nr:hypothetical protein [Nevskia sp.]
MGKLAQPLTSEDLNPQPAPGAAPMRQRGVPPSAELDSLNFKLPAAFVKEFKREALDCDMKLNELLIECFQHRKTTRTA